MPEPFRLRAQKALGARLEELTYEYDGSSTPMAGRVFRGRQYFGEETPVPFISILEEPIAPEQDMETKSGTGSEGPYELMVQGFVPDDKENPTDPAHFLLALVKRKLAQVIVEGRASDRLLAFPDKAPTVTSLRFGGGVVRPPDEISAVAYFWLRVTLDLVEDHENSFA